MMNNDRKVALITGGTHGIGAAVAKQLASCGYDLALVARHDRQALIDELRLLGSNVLMITADLKSEEGCTKAVESAREMGRIDTIVHLAGGAVPGRLEDISVEAWEQAFDVHVHAVFHLSRAALPLMKKSGGSIVLVSSAAGLRGVKNALAYAVVKGALPQFARALAYELSDYGIRVNCVSPGIIRTRFQDMLSPEQAKNNIENRIPLHREGTPGQIADVIKLLVQHQYITGENVVVDGGLTMRIV